MNVIAVKCFTVGVKWLLGHPVHVYCVILCSTKRIVNYKFRGVCVKRGRGYCKGFFSCFWERSSAKSSMLERL